MIEHQTDNPIQWIQLVEIKAIYNKAGNEKEQYVRPRRM